VTGRRRGNLTGSQLMSLKKPHFENLLIDEFVEGRKWSGGQL
jgi:hypothetical protein